MLFYSMWDRQLAEKQSLPTIIRGVERVGPPGGNLWGRSPGEITGEFTRGKSLGGNHLDPGPPWASFLEETLNK